MENPTSGLSVLLQNLKEKKNIEEHKAGDGYKSLISPHPWSSVKSIIKKWKEYGCQCT